jgi:hypothetical protein
VRQALWPSVILEPFCPAHSNHLQGQGQQHPGGPRPEHRSHREERPHVRIHLCAFVCACPRTRYTTSHLVHAQGEDPVLGGKLGVRVVAGIQKSVMAIAKHYLLNNQETDRSGGNMIADEKTIMELYAPPFEAVAATVAGYMCSYHLRCTTIAARNLDWLRIAEVGLVRHRCRCWCIGADTTASTASMPAKTPPRSARCSRATTTFRGSLFRCACCVFRMLAASFSKGAVCGFICVLVAVWPLVSRS